MIPEDVNIADLTQQLNEDSVAIAHMGETYPYLEGQLIEVVEHARTSGFGELKIVVLDQTPEVVADLRDIAQELQNVTGADGVIVRAPGTGAVVVEGHSRATLESAQYYLLGNPDYAAGSREFVDSVNAEAFPWMSINIIGAAIILVAILATALAVYFKTVRGR